LSRRSFGAAVAMAHDQNKPTPPLARDRFRRQVFVLTWQVCNFGGSGVDNLLRRRHYAVGTTKLINVFGRAMNTF
jgi:hypothetical protein